MYMHINVHVCMYVSILYVHLYVSMHVSMFLCVQVGWHNMLKVSLPFNNTFTVCGSC